ncbi:mechanosensitive ion channel family protein [Candidatus Zixiibacteriota bacterium]
MMESVNLSNIVDTLVALVSTWGLKVIGAIAAFIVGRMAAGWIRKGIRKALDRSRLEQTLVIFLSRLVYYAVLTFVIISVLGILGVETASLAVVLGAAGLAIGLALQGTLSNFASGIMLMFFRPIKIDDVVEVGGVLGKVAEVGIFSTRINTADNVHIVVPNSNVYGQTIKNFSANEIRRVDLVMGIHYDDDIGLAIETLRGVLRSDERVLAEPEPTLVVGELADSSVNILVRPWCGKDDYWTLKWDLTWKCKEELERAGITIPFPQRDVHLFQE